MVDEPDPGAATDVGLKLTDNPLPPDADNAIAELKLPDAAVLIVVLPDPLRLTVMLDGPAEIVNPPVTAAFTVKETLVVCVSPPPVPVTVMLYVPAAVPAATFNVMFEEPEPGALIEAGLNPTVTPPGAPEAVNPTAELNPPDTAVVTVELPLPPAVTDTAVGEAEIVKAGVCVVDPVSAAIRPVFGLPHPVTRS